jgi:hypothetical protein
LEEERKQKKNAYRVFHRNFCSEKKLQEKKPQRRKKRGRMQRRSRKVTKCTPSHPGPLSLSLSLSLSPSTRMNNSKNKEKALVSSHQTLNSETLSFIQQGLEFLGFKRTMTFIQKGGTRNLYLKKKEANMRVSSNMGIKKKRGFKKL